MYLPYKDDKHERAAKTRSEACSDNFRHPTFNMKRSILFAAASLVLGIGVGFFAPGLGVVVSVSVTGLGIMNILESNKR